MTVSQLWLPNSIYEQGPSFSYIVKQLADKQDKPLVFLIDEADRLVPKEQEAGWPLFGEMRALAEKGNCQFIFAGEESLESAVKNAYSPFFNFAKKIPVGLLDKAPVFELITRTLKQQLEIEFVQENMVIERIYTFTSGHPNVVQRLCENLLTIVNKRQIRQITPADVETVIQSPSFQLNDFLQAFWSKATFLEMAISLVMAEDSRHYYNLREIRQKLTMQWGLEIKATQVQQALVRLEELRNILKRTQKGYTFAVSAFPEVIAKTVTTEDALEVLAEQFHEYGDIYLSGFNSAEELGL